MFTKLAPGTEAMLANAIEASEFLKHFSHPSRLMIACALVDGEMSVREMEDCLHLRQPALSQQIAGLREAGIITGRKVSRNTIYRLADDRVRLFVTTLHDLFCA